MPFHPQEALQRALDAARAQHLEAAQREAAMGEGVVSRPPPSLDLSSLPPLALRLEHIAPLLDGSDAVSVLLEVLLTPPEAPTAGPMGQGMNGEWHGSGPPASKV